MEVKRYHDIIKEFDIHHLTSMCVGISDQYREYVDVSDVFMVDPYPIRSGQQYQVTMVSDCVEAALTAMRTAEVNKPLWSVLQAFGYQNDENKGWGWDREPTKQEMKAMTYLAIVKGVSGIFYYTYHGSQYFIKDSPIHWDNLKAIVWELREIYPLLVSGEVEDVVAKAFETEEAESQLFWTVRQVVEGNILIKPGTYLLVVNGSTKFVTATFELNNNFSYAEMLREDRTLSCLNGILSDYFEPYEVHIYFLG